MGREPAPLGAMPTRHHLIFISFLHFRVAQAPKRVLHMLCTLAANECILFYFSAHFFFSINHLGDLVPPADPFFSFFAAMQATSAVSIATMGASPDATISPRANADSPVEATLEATHCCSHCTGMPML